MSEILAKIPGLAECRQQTLGDPEICIAIIDSRADLSHPSFSGAQIQEVMPMWMHSVMGGRGGAAHGTHVASQIFGQPGGPVEGIVPRCRGIIIPVYGETEGGELRACSQEDLARAISLALEAGASLINISGGELIQSGEEDPFLAKAVASCDQQDVLVLAATGNEGCECLHMPAALPTVLAVGAADADAVSPYLSAIGTRVSPLMACLRQAKKFAERSRGWRCSPRRHQLCVSNCHGRGGPPAQPAKAKRPKTKSQGGTRCDRSVCDAVRRCRSGRV